MTTDQIMPRISVVIPVRNGARNIDRQLRALTIQDVDEPFEVIVADNGSVDETVSIANSWTDRLPGLKVVDASGPRRAAHARNLGAENCSGELILFCDADDRVHAEWVRELALGLTSYDAVGGRSLIVDAGTPSETTIGELGLSTIHGYLPYAVSCNCGVRREQFFRVGGFDGSYNAGHEEVDFFWRLQEVGGTLGYVPNAMVDYRQRNTLLSLFRQRRRYATSSILLWTRFEDHAELNPVSFSGSLKHCTRALTQAGRLLQSEARPEYVAAFGWTCGLVEGHLRYRILGKPPPRELMTEASSRGH